MATYSNYSVFYEGRKIGVAKESEYTIKNNNEPVFNDNGFDGTTTGNITFELTVTLSTRFGGDVTKFEDLVLNGGSAEIMVAPVNGRTHMLTAFSNETAFKANMEKRSTEQTVKLHGGKPKVVSLL